MGSLPYLFFILAFIALGTSAPVLPSTGADGTHSTPTPSDGDAAVEAVRFMRRFGYLESVTPEGEALYAKDTIREALLLVQKFGDIEQTGVLDENTVRLMRSPRCGVQDFLNESSSAVQQRKKRYVIGSEGWKKRNVTYRLVNWSPKIGKTITETEFEKAFEAWSGYSRLKFSPAQPYYHADIEIFFARGPHGDGYPMDGPGGVLAHAFYPYEAGHWGGDMHFDEDEEWKVKPALDQGVDVFTVAVHELGHSLGLAHSFVSSSVMFPYYKGPQANFRLDMDDIYGLYQLYISTYSGDDEDDADTGNWDGGEREEGRGGEGDGEGQEGGGGEGGGGRGEGGGDRGEGGERGGGEDERGGGRGEEDGRERGGEEDGGGRGESDADGEGERREEEGCSGEGCRDTPGGRRGGSRHNCSTQDICSGRIDAASLLRDELFFFSGECVWRMKHRGIPLKGYPVPIRQLFRHFPINISRVDAVYQRHNDSSIVAFTGKQFWVSDGNRLIQNSPRPLTDYGLPATLDKVNSIMIWGKNGKTFIFSSDRYWRFNESTSIMDEGYPKSITRWRGVPENLDAALTWTDGATYFFYDSKFWRFDNTLIKTEEGFPMATSDVWFDCP